jgi:hypothetical protein
VLSYGIGGGVDEAWLIVEVDLALYPTGRRPSHARPARLAAPSRSSCSYYNPG